MPEKAYHLRSLSIDSGPSWRAPALGPFPGAAVPRECADPSRKRLSARSGSAVSEVGERITAARPAGLRPAGGAIRRK